MLLSEEAIYFLASKKKIEFLRQASNGSDENSVPPVKLLVRDRVSGNPHSLIGILNKEFVFRVTKIKRISKKL